MTKNGPKIDFQLKIGPYKYGDLELVILFANPAKRSFARLSAQSTSTRCSSLSHQHQMQLPIPPAPTGYLKNRSKLRNSFLKNDWYGLLKEPAN